jgi:transposase InsO family protein
MTATEKREAIRLVEESDLSVRRTLREPQLPRTSFYRWYRRYRVEGLDGLQSRASAARRHWNRIPAAIRQRVVDLALAAPERTPRELAWQFTDREGHFLSESSVYRILKAYDLITSPAFIVLAAGKTFQHPTRRPNELWQTDFTYLHVVRWGWYYLSTVLDDFLRYILAWTLRTSMSATDVMETLNLARAAAAIDRVPVVHRPRPLRRQRAVLRLGGTGDVPGDQWLRPHARRPLPSDDAGQDRTVSPLAEERREARSLLQPLGIGTGDRSLRGGVPSPAVSRVAAERDAGGCLLRPAGRDPVTSGADQTADTAAAEAGELTHAASRGYALRSVSLKLHRTVPLRLTTYTRPA